MTVLAAPLRPAAASDLDRILELEAAGFEHARWSRRSWADEIAGHYVVVAGEGEPEGVAAFSVLADVAELLRVVVAPARRGAGLGGALVADGIAWAEKQGAERMLLEVEESNAAARALYARTGFATIARRNNYYGTGAHALVMQRELSHE